MAIYGNCGGIRLWVTHYVLTPEEMQLPNNPLWTEVTWLSKVILNKPEGEIEVWHDDNCDGQRLMAQKGKVLLKFHLWDKTVFVAAVIKLTSSTFGEHGHVLVSYEILNATRLNV